MIYTFYSFKGGVGRSMALANVAELMYRRGLRVLIVDFDLEAPGLERFFDTRQEATAIGREDVLAARGMIDMVLSYKQMRGLLKLSVPRSREQPDQITPAPPQSGGSDFLYPVEPLINFIFPLYPEGSNGGALYLI